MNKHGQEINRRCAAGRIAASGLLIPTLLGCTSNSQIDNPSRELLIVNGKVVGETETNSIDIRIRDETIVEMGQGLSANASTSRVIDAKGDYVTPGGVDPHVHLSPPWADNFESGSRAALAGGITTLGQMVSASPNESLLKAVERTKSAVRKQSAADVFLHAIINSAADFDNSNLAKLIEAGVTSIKLFMVVPEFANSLVSAQDVIRVAGKLGMLTMIHAEDYQLVSNAIKQLKSEKKTSLRYYAESRPAASEFVAVQTALNICQETNAPIYLVHLSTAKSIALCEQARQHGLPIFTETRPMYLYYTDEIFEQEKGPLFVGMPPLRTAGDIDSLWNGLGNDTIQTIATDHAPWTAKQKMDRRQTIETPNGGVNNLQFMLPMLMNDGVLKQKITIQQFVNLTSTNAAKLFGLFPRKGTIKIGSDADIVVWDSSKPSVINGRQGYSKAGYSIHDGKQIATWPKYTIRRGEIVFQDEKIAPEPGPGAIINRKPKRITSSNIDRL